MIKLVVRKASFYKAFHSLRPHRTAGSWCIIIGSLLVALEWKKWYEECKAWIGS